ncbi:MAG: Glu-tRNA(Gln) amidotransferase subunit GatD [Candidatus Heimdallarchaeota archaeon]|nr:Glu-tRNA(Gln) amidotransferase subunit GatD [Candidatus Heimdallarchaeota archaeon]
MGNYKGVILPRGQHGDDKHIVVKVSSGYNVSFDLDSIIEIKELGKIEADYKIPDKKFSKDPNKPIIALIGTGGTVASRLDYRTGAVIPAFSTQELYNSVPEIRDLCNLETRTIFQKFSENIEPTDWITIANEIVSCIENINPQGIVCTHGTDTIHFTAAALSFILKNLDRPIVLIGSQRSSDRPSSDAANNLINGIQVAVNSDIAEVVVCMLGSSGDSYNLVHRGTRVRKMHTSRRDAFRSIGEKPIAKIVDSKIIYTNDNFVRRNQKKGNLEVDAKIDPNVGLLYSYPGMKSELIDYFIEKKYSALVIAGTGLGHTSQKLIDSFYKAKEKNMPIFMTSQCFWGFTGLSVYETGRMLLTAGVIPLANMLPEVALVKAMWVLGHTKEILFIKELMQQNLSGEITERETFNDYLILQGETDYRTEKVLQKEEE